MKKSIKEQVEAIINPDICVYQIPSRRRMELKLLRLIRKACRDCAKAGVSAGFNAGEDTESFGGSTNALATAFDIADEYVRACISGPKKAKGKR